MALVNQKTGTRQGNANYVLYRLAAESGATCTSDSSAIGNPSCIFYAVTRGNNSLLCKTGVPSCVVDDTAGYGVLVEPSSL